MLLGQEIYLFNGRIICENSATLTSEITLLNMLCD